MTEPRTAAGRALLQYLDVSAREVYMPFDRIRPSILAIEATVEALVNVTDDLPEDGPTTHPAEEWYERGWRDRAEAILAALEALP